MKTTIKQIEEIFNSNNIPLIDVRHDLKAVKLAVNHMVECTNIDDANDIVNLVFFNEPITEMYTHSYGFHTRQGREIIETFKNNYYNLIN